MAIELQQNLRLQQQLVMTPQLQMAIKLLQLSRLELADVIRQEMENNPTLEEYQDTENETETEASFETTDAPAIKEVSIEEKFDNFLDWHNYLDEYHSTGKIHFESEKRDAPDLEAFIATPTSLADHLRWQLLMIQPAPEDEIIGSLIIGNLSPEGYLDFTVEGISRLSGYGIEKVKQVLMLMQTFDPPGICAADLQECLLLQVDYLQIEHPLIKQIIRFHLKDLENKRYKAIARACRTSIEDVVGAVNVIRRLDPRPGDKYQNEQQIYIIPDVYVYKEDDDFIIVLNDDDMPRLHINSYYKHAVRKGQAISEDAKIYLKDRLRSAEWLIKSIHHRRKTIYNVMASIIKFQHDFFEHGITHLKPMVLRDVADDINMHESTISRVTTNKYAYTPQGLFELKFFFNSSINRLNGDTIASASVQDRIRRIIEGENPKKPLSDKKIAELLSSADIDIARRTIAKYRDVMGILSSSKRKQF